MNTRLIVESELTPFESNRQALIAFYEGTTLYKVPEQAARQGITLQGACKKGIVLVLPRALNEYNEATREMLLKILAAQGLGQDDTGVVVAGSAPGFSYADLLQQVQPVAVILYGVQPSLLGLTLSPYDFYHEGAVKMLYADDLDTLASSQPLKAKLWGVLKQHFMYS